MADPDDVAPSPCLRVCKLDPATGWCVGCGRSYDEQRRWHALTSAERTAATAALPHRLATLRSSRR